MPADTPRLTPFSVTIVAAVAENGVIGRGNALPWHLSSDLKRFKALTLGKTLVMGRRTYDSIGRTLPGRRTIVVTRIPIEGLECTGSLENALKMAETDVFLAGGAAIYREGLNVADGIEITRVHANPEGDVCFPTVPEAMFEHVSTTPGIKGERDDHSFSYESYRRRR
ncbi:MAG: dihydrofolate reductase [Pseudomonadota bacterium]